MRHEFIKIIMAILVNFGKTSGLEINFEKYGFLPIAIPADLTPTLASIVHCNPLSTPIHYLASNESRPGTIMSKLL
jgi:hypothetical protein